MDEPIRWEQSDGTLENAYYLGVSDALAQLERQGIITPAQRGAAYRDAPDFAAELAEEDDDREDDHEPAGGNCAYQRTPESAACERNAPHHCDDCDVYLCAEHWELHCRVVHGAEHPFDYGY